MKRRDFLCNSLTAAGAIGLTATAVAADLGSVPPPSTRHFVEIRTYTVPNAGKRDLFVKILDNAFIPAMNRQGIKNIGVFVPVEGQEKFANDVFVVRECQALNAILGVSTLVADKEFMEAAQEIFATDSKNPVFTACDSRLLQCFETLPTLQTPELGEARAFEMRLYRSFNIERNAAKIHMFEHGGELALFRELGLNPIFFGEAVFGRMLPNLAYMVGGKSADALAESWKKFGPHPKWHELRDNTMYNDTATEIERVILKPSAGSQI